MHFWESLTYMPCNQTQKKHKPTCSQNRQNNFCSTPYMWKTNSILFFFFPWNQFHENFHEIVFTEKMNLFVKFKSIKPLMWLLPVPYSLNPLTSKKTNLFSYRNEQPCYFPNYFSLIFNMHFFCTMKKTWDISNGVFLSLDRIRIMITTNFKQLRNHLNPTNS